jgi:hypothetical protein
MSQSASGTIEHSGEGERRRGCAGKGRWSGWEIAAIVLGFVIFWPVGLIALFWKLFKGELWPGSRDGNAPWAKWQGFDVNKWRWQDGFRTHSGNSAFEAYKTRELEKLEQLRRKLAEDQKAFGEFVERVKRAKDQEEFDRFMAERNAPQEPTQSV